MTTTIKNHIDTDGFIEKLRSFETSGAEANIGILAKDAGKPKQGFKKHLGSRIKVTMKGITIGEVAAFNEFGTKDIPERSFIRSTFDSKISEWNADFGKLLEQVLYSDQSIEWALTTIAEKIKSDIKSRIIEISKNDQNAESTKRHKGKDTPLIATRELFRSIDCEVIV